MKKFLPISKEEIVERGWDQIDFLFVSGDAYVDHPSFGPAVICRVLEAQGYRVALLCQPDWTKLWHIMSSRQRTGRRSACSRFPKEIRCMWESILQPPCCLHHRRKL